jgi:hypothetical protein
MLCRALAFLCLALLPGCSPFGLTDSFEPKTFFYSPEDGSDGRTLLKAELQADRALAVEAGMPIWGVEQWLTESGFTCTDGPVNAAEPYLEFHASTAEYPVGAGLQLVVRVYHKDGKVTRRAVKGRMVGPFGPVAILDGKEWDVEPKEKENHSLYWPQIVEKK